MYPALLSDLKITTRLFFFSFLLRRTWCVNAIALYFINLTCTTSLFVMEKQQCTDAAEVQNRIFCNPAVCFEQRIADQATPIEVVYYCYKQCLHVLGHLIDVI